MNLSKNYLMRHIKVSMQTLNLTTGGTSYIFDNLFKAKLLDLIGLATVADTAATGSYPANPFKLQNFGLKESRCQPTRN